MFVYSTGTTFSGTCVSLLFQASPPSLQDSLPSLPAGWPDQTVATPLNVLQLCNTCMSHEPCVSSQPVVDTCCLTISNDFMCRAYVHGHNVTPKITSRSLSSISTKLTSVSLQALLELLNCYRVCIYNIKAFFSSALITGRIASVSPEC